MFSNCDFSCVSNFMAVVLIVADFSDAGQTTHRLALWPPCFMCDERCCYLYQPDNASSCPQWDNSIYKCNSTARRDDDIVHVFISSFKRYFEEGVSGQHCCLLCKIYCEISCLYPWCRLEALLYYRSPVLIP